jgi:hypothetical protein
LAPGFGTVMIGDLKRDGTLLELERSNCHRHL